MQDNKQLGYAVRFMLDVGCDKARVIELVTKLGVRHQLTPKTLSIYGLYEDRHLELFQAFAAEGCFSAKHCLFFDQRRRMTGKDYYWIDDESVLGAVFRPVSSHSGRDSPAEIYHEQHRCGGLVKDDAVVNFYEPLTKRKVFAGQNGSDAFFTPRLIRLMDIEDGVFADTTLNGQQYDLKRLLKLPGAPVDFIDAHWSSPAPGVHELCGLRYIHHYDLWIARGNEPLDAHVTLSTSPYRHVDYDRQILISTEMARKLIRNRAKVIIDPIFASDSAVAHDQKRLLECLRAAEEASR